MENEYVGLVVEELNIWDTLHNVSVSQVPKDENIVHRIQDSPIESLMGQVSQIHSSSGSALLQKTKHLRAQLSIWDDKRSKKESLILALSNAANSELKSRITIDIQRIDKRLASLFSDIREAADQLRSFRNLSTNTGVQNIDSKMTSNLTNSPVVESSEQLGQKLDSLKLNDLQNLNLDSLDRETINVPAEEYDALLTKLELLSSKLKDTKEGQSLAQVIDELSKCKARCNTLQETLESLPLENIWKQDWISKLKSKIVMMDLSKKSEEEKELVQSILDTLVENGLPMKLEVSRRKRISRESTITLSIALNKAIEEKKALQKAYNLAIEAYEKKVSDLNADLQDAKKQLPLLPPELHLEPSPASRKLHETMDQLIIENQQLKHDLEQKTKAFDLQLQDLNSTILNVQQSKQSSEAMLNNQVIQEQNFNWQLRQQCIQLEEQVSVWQHKFDVLIKERAIAEAKQHILEEELEDLNAEKEQLQVRVRESEIQFNDLLAQKQKEIENLHNFYNQPRTSVTKVDPMSLPSNPEDKDLATALHIMQQKLSHSQFIIEQYKSKKESLTSTVKELRSRLSQLDDSQKQLLEKYSTFNAESMARSSKSMADAQSSIQTISKQLEVAQSQLAGKNNEIQTLKQQLENLHLSNLSRCKTCQDLQMKLQVAEGNLFVLKKTLDEVTSSNW